MNVSSKLKPGDAVAGALFEHAPVAMLMIDRAGRVEHANSAAEQLFGYSSEALVGNPVELLCPMGCDSDTSSIVRPSSKRPLRGRWERAGG